MRENFRKHLQIFTPGNEGMNEEMSPNQATFSTFIIILLVFIKKYPGVHCILCLVFFSSKIIFDQKLFPNCFDKFGYQGSIVQLSCFSKIQFPKKHLSVHSVLSEAFKSTINMKVSQIVPVNSFKELDYNFYSLKGNSNMLLGKSTVLLNKSLFD